MQKASLLSVAILLASTTLAPAAFLTGDLEIGGGSNTVNIATTTPLTGTIQFVTGGNVLAVGTNGSFTPLIGDAASFPAGTLNFNALTAAAIQPFLTVDGLTYTLQSETTNLNTVGGSSIFSIVGSGTFHLAGFQDTPGTFDLSTQSVGGAFVNTSFSASAVAVPGPIVGAGLPGLLSLLLGGGGVWWRKRRQALQSAS